MAAPYTIILDLSRPKHFNAWQADPADMRAIFARWVRGLDELGVREARVVCGTIPEVVRGELARSPKVSFHPADPAAPAGAIARTAAGVAGEIVLLAGGSVWIEPLLSELVEEHRAAGRRASLCAFHAGFAPIIGSAASFQSVPAVAHNVEWHFRRLLDQPPAGVAEIRRPIPNLNLYARPDLPEGWECLAWMSRSDQARELWKIPQKFREGFVGTRENYRRSFRAISVFRDLEGARVLEIGCSPDKDTGPRMLFEEFGIGQYAGVNLDPIKFSWRHPKASFHTGDATLAPYEPGSFDLVFSIAVWEHVHNPRVLFHRVSRWLAPGGAHYGKFQVWSSAHGYHLPPCGFPSGRQPAFCHLTMTPDELRAHMARTVADGALVDRGVERVYEDGYINRVRAAEFIDIIRTCGLEPVYLDGRSGGRISDEARRAAAKLGGEYTAEELSVEGFEFYLRKSDFRLMDMQVPAGAAAATT